MAEAGAGSTAEPASGTEADAAPGPDPGDQIVHGTPVASRGLVAAAGAVPGLSNHLTVEMQFSLQRWAVYAFVIAAVTDFFDGWLARRLNATSIWGAILDPIGDKVLVCGAVLGLLSLGPQPMVVPGEARLGQETAGQGAQTRQDHPGRPGTCFSANQSGGRGKGALEVDRLAGRGAAGRRRGGGGEAQRASS